MATLTVGPGFSVDMSALDVGSLLQGTITVENAHLFQVAFDLYDFVDFIGNFTYSGSDGFGTLQQIRDYSGGYLWFSVANMSVNAHTFEELAIAGNSSGALSLVLAGNDVINGGSFADVLLGFNGNDVLNGAGGSDILRGMAGDDRITGGAGIDRLSGGPGNDTFVFRPGFGNDTITDFSSGPTAGDVIEMHGLLHSLADVKSHSHLSAGHLVIAVDASDTITLNTVHSKAALSANDFHFFA